VAKFKIKPFKSIWANAAHLGLFVDWDEIDQVDLGMDLGSVSLGIRLRWGHRVIDPNDVDKKPWYALGTRLQNDFGCWRYGCAGERLTKGTLVEPGLAAQLLDSGNLPPDKPFGELIYGDLRAVLAIHFPGKGVLGWPDVDVPEHYYFWMREMPPGAKFKKEEPGIENKPVKSKINRLI